MQTDQSFTEDDKQQLQTRLARLDKNAIVQLAARCALRVFPLLAKKNGSSEYFYYWTGRDRLRHLLAIWQALLSHNPHNTRYPFGDPFAVVPHKDAVAAANTTLDTAVYAVHAAANAAYAANAAKVAHDSDAGYIVSAVEAAAAAVSAFPNTQSELEFDLSQFENKKFTKLVTFPLWQTPNSNNYTSLMKDLSEALKQVSVAQTADIKPIIDEIWPIYQGIFEGQPNQQAIEKAIDQLNEYFFGEGIEENERVLAGKANSIDKNNKTDKTNNLHLNENNVETIAGNRHNSHQYAAEDKLNRQQLVNTLAALLQEKNNHHHQTIGLLGYWGVGKTSVVELLKSALQTKDKTADQGKVKEFIFADFNAWEYEHTDNLQAGIAQEMINALSSPEPKLGCLQKFGWPFRKIYLTLRFAFSLHTKKVLILLLLFVAALAPIWIPDSLKNMFVSLMEPFGTSVISIFPYVWGGAFLMSAFRNTKAVFAGPLAKELLTYLNLPSYGKHLGTIPVMREHIKKLTQIRLGTDQRLLYVVDDLDRCGHKGIVKVLEAVRMVLDLDNVIVVIAVDQRIALAALALNYKELATQYYIEDPRLIARDYLAKIIHLPIVLTEPDEASVSSYLAHLWEQTSSQDSNTPTTHAEILPNDNPNKNSTSNTKKGSPSDSVELEKENKQEESDLLPKIVEPNIEAIKINPPIAPKKVKRVEQLTDPQKHAFTYWLKHFELSNPRQIKRLNNSFNLLRNFYGEDEIINDITTKTTLQDVAFPMMVTLFAFEYLNNLKDMKKRDILETLISVENFTFTVKEETYLINSKITSLVIELANHRLGNISMIKAVEPFVLPGIKSNEEKT